MRMRRALRAFALLTVVFVASPAWADPTPAPAASSGEATPAPAQGVAVVASGASARDDAFSLARSVYASSLRPRQLDELRARILAGDPAPPTASADVRDLAELRASVVSEDAASRRLLSAIAQQMHVAGILVVTRREPEASAPAATPEASAAAPAADAGPSVAAAPAPAPPAAPVVTARLFIPETGEFDAARYEPEVVVGGGGTTWRGTVNSLSSRFPPPNISLAQVQGAPPKIMPTEKQKESHPFYTSSWFWGAVGAAAVIGGIFFLASQDTSSDPIHLQMRVPR